MKSAQPYAHSQAKVQVQTVFPYCLISVSAVYCKDSIQVQVSIPHTIDNLYLSSTKFLHTCFNDNIQLHWDWML